MNLWNETSNEKILFFLFDSSLFSEKKCPSTLYMYILAYCRIYDDAKNKKKYHYAYLIFNIFKTRVFSRTKNFILFFQLVSSLPFWSYQRVGYIHPVYSMHLRRIRGYTRKESRERSHEKYCCEDGWFVSSNSRGSTRAFLSSAVVSLAEEKGNPLKIIPRVKYPGNYITLVKVLYYMLLY